MHILVQGSERHPASTRPHEGAMLCLLLVPRVEKDSDAHWAQRHWDQEWPMSSVWSPPGTGSAGSLLF